MIFVAVARMILDTDLAKHFDQVGNLMGGTQVTPQIRLLDAWRKASISHMFDSLMRMVFFVVAGVDNKDAHEM